MQGGQLIQPKLAQKQMLELLNRLGRLPLGVEQMRLCCLVVQQIAGIVEFARQTLGLLEQGHGRAYTPLLKHDSRLGQQQLNRIMLAIGLQMHRQRLI